MLELDDPGGGTRTAFRTLRDENSSVFHEYFTYGM